MLRLKLSVLSWLFLLAATSALNNGLGSTPQLGWSTWNHFFCDINETVILESAKAIKAHGLLELGYEYIAVRAERTCELVKITADF